MTWTADLTDVRVDPANAAAVNVTITYTDADADPPTVAVQTFATAEPDHIPLVAAGWIAQRQKIADYAASAWPRGPMDLSGVAAGAEAAAASRKFAKDLLVAQALKGAIDLGVRTAQDPAYIAAVQSVADGVAAVDNAAAFTPKG